MLQNIRDRLTGPFVWFIVGLIVIPFAFWGIESFRTGGGDPTVAKVGDQKITQSQFRAGYQQRLQQLQAMMGENFRQDLIDNARFRQGVLDDMIQESMLRQHVQKEGYRASDAMVFEQISTIPAFQENGKFSTESYRNLLSARGYTPQRFETQLRDSLVIEQMREGILESGFVAPAGAASAYRLDEQQRALAYAVFPVAKYQAQASVDPADVQKRYDEQKAKYQAPERLKLAYVELALEDLPPAAAPAADYLRSIYDAEKATRFTTVEERRARHILINFGPDKQQAKKRIDAIADQIGKGADFATLAGSQSDDPGSKKKGGDLGWVRHGQMLEKFEKTLFALKKGEVSEPVETEFGWHVIKLEDVKESRTQPFEDPEVQAELLRVYRQKDAEHRFQEMSEKLEQTAFESPASLEPAAKAVDLPVKTTGWFTRTAGEGIAAQANVREVAFGEDVLKNGENSKPLSIGENRVVVIHKQEYEAPRPLAFEEVKDKIRDDLKAEAARAKASADVAATLEALKSGRPLEQVAREKRADYKAAGLVKRSATGIDAPVLDALFKLPRPAAGEVRADQVRLPNGDIAVVAVTEVRDADWSGAGVADQKRESEQLKAALSGAEFTAYRADLQKRMELKIVNPPEADQPEPTS
jgi:peptidyl-prolyl cis-trans isomerase D